MQLQVSAVADTEVALYWVDGKDGVTVPAGDSPRQIELQRSFPTLDEARAFEGMFAVAKGGNEIARETVRFDACDRVATYGADPAGIVTVVVGRTLTDHLQADTLRKSQGPLGCYRASASLRINADSAIHRAIYNLPLAIGTAGFRLGDNNTTPASLQLWDDHVVYVLHLDFPSSLPLDADLGQLSVSVGGAPVGSVTVTFANCSAADPAAFAQEEQWLALPEKAEGSVAVDRYGGYLCTNHDGSGFGAIP